VTDVTIFGLRVLFAGLLYFFLFVIGVFIWRDLRNRGTVVTSVDQQSLVVVDGATSGLRRGQKLQLSSPAIIGRSPACSVVLPDTSVSSRHASLTLRDSRWWLEDLGSTNGTRINGRAVEQQAVVTPGDDIEFGRVRVSFSRA
jgi:pSer/pThr/pTyr-binding forkhead associated (FHA) protein